MTKEEVLAKIEAYKGNPIEIFCDNTIILYAGLDGHYVFEDEGGLGLIEITKNSSKGLSGVNGVTQTEAPYVIQYAPYEMIQYMRAYVAVGKDTIPTVVNASLKAVNDDRSTAEILKEIMSDPIMSARSTRGYQYDERYHLPGEYGGFRGGVITGANGSDFSEKLTEILNSQNSSESSDGSGE